MPRRNAGGRHLIDMTMDNPALTLEYANEDDRAYGLAGMAISVAALDAIDKIASVSLDADGPMVTFSHYYYFCGSPSVSPKASWNHTLNNFYLTSAMVVSNVMARSLVRLGREIPRDIMTRVHDEIDAEGRDSCSLEADEIDRIYRKTTSYMQRIFGNPRLHPAIKDFARTLSRRRSMSGTEIFDELRALRIL